MKVLVATRQYIKVEGNHAYCIRNVYDILERFSHLGELYICAYPYNPATSKKHLVIDTCMDKIFNPKHFFPLKRQSRLMDQFTMSAENKKIMREAIDQVDLVIVYLQEMFGHYAIKYARSKGKPVLSYVVGCTWDALWNYNWQGKIMAPISYIRRRNAVAKSDYALYVTQEFLQRRYPTKGFSIGCSDVAIAPIDDNILTKRLKYIEDSDIKKELNIVTTAGVNVPYKGQAYVIEAISKLKKAGDTRYHYYLIGGGDATRLKNLAKALDVENQIHFVGILPHTEVFGELDKMHVYIQPSMQEGLPRSMAEGMSRGLMAIGTTTGGIPELVAPHNIVRKRNSDDIVKLLKNITSDILKEEAKFSLDKAKQYQGEVLDARREQFFDEIKRRINK
ncbi:MAG: glycosyltransferase [Bacteroidales bacterium]|nr:glycosyltransferase [Bacteroidales bacterium]